MFIPVCPPIWINWSLKQFLLQFLAKLLPSKIEKFEMIELGLTSFHLEMILKFHAGEKL